MITPEGVVVSDSFAIAAEMHSSFGGLRGGWPVNLRHSFTGAVAPPAIEAKLDRLVIIWSNTLAKTGSKGARLCGNYCIADVIFAPMAARLATYVFDTRPTSKAYVAAYLADPAFQKWRADGLVLDPVMPNFEANLPTALWPV